MADILSGLVGAYPVTFCAGTELAFQELAVKDNKSLYAVAGTTKDGKDVFYLYLGAVPVTSIAASNITVDSALSLTSLNPVQNKVITLAIDEVKSIFKDDSIGVLPINMEGKFLYTVKSASVAGSQDTLKFFFGAENSISLIPVDTITSSNGKSPVSEGAVYTAIQNKFNYSTVIPAAPTQNTLYVENNTLKWFYDIVGKKSIILAADSTSTFALKSHADTSGSNGKATATNYGHACSGITVSDSSASLVGATYVSKTSKDKDILGIKLDNFARVDHKHPYPDILSVYNDSASNQNAFLNIIGLKPNVLAFIAEPVEGYEKVGEIVTPASTLIKNIKTDLSSNYFKKSGGTITGNTTFQSALIVSANSKTALQVEQSTASVVGKTSIGGALLVSGSATFSSGVSVSAGNTTLQGLTATSISSTGTLSSNGNANLAGQKLVVIAGTVQTGISDVTVNGKLKVTSTVEVSDIRASSIIVNGTSSLNGAIEGSSSLNIVGNANISSDGTNYLIATNTVNKTVTINAATTTVKALIASSLTISNNSLSLNTLTLGAYTLNSSNGLSCSGNSDRILIQGINGASSKNITYSAANNTFLYNGSEIMNTTTANNTFVGAGYVTTQISALGLGTASKLNSTTSVTSGNGALVTSGAVYSYVPKTTSVSSGSSSLVTSGAVYTAIQNKKVFQAGTTAPSDTSLLWIDTSIGNGAIKYYTGSAWKTISAVWS